AFGRHRIVARATIRQRGSDMNRSGNRSILRYAAEIIVVLSAVVPLYLLLKQSITPELESFAWPPLWMPRMLTSAHFTSVLAVGELRAALLRSVWVAIVSGAVATILGAMLAYAMARSAWGQALGFGAV